MEIITRKQAIARQLDRYFTGKTCKHGHVDQRNTSSRECYGCARDRDKKRKDRQNRNARNRYADNQQWREKKLAAVTDRWKAGEEQRRSQRKPRSKMTKEEVSKKYKEWLQSDRGRMSSQAQTQRRRSLKKAAKGYHNGEEIAQLLFKQKDACAICAGSIAGRILECGRERVAYEADHIVPLSRGGSNDIGNIQLLCPGCNRRKGSKLMCELVTNKL